MFTSKRNHRRTVNGTGRLSPDRPIRTVNEFRDMIEYERARSNRSGLPFCVVVFDAKANGAEIAALDRVSMILQDRLRDTDEVGWISDRQIAALLPYTTAENASGVAREVCEQIPEEFRCPQVEVLFHPSRPPHSPNGHVVDRHWEQADDDDADPDDNMPSSESPSGDGTEPNAANFGMERWFAMAIPSWKRTMDVLLSATALLLLSPLMVVIAICIKLMSPGPVMFKQRRTGLGGQVFEMHKFRTMTVNAEADQAALLASNEQDGPAFKMKHDPRITRIGSVLRKTSLDELPQLWNVLRGDMSLVGPRPLPCHEANACEPWQYRRLDVTPGITCIWQTEGRSRVTFDEWMRMDIRYIRSRSIRRDFALLFRTVWAIASCRGAQ